MSNFSQGLDMTNQSSYQNGNCYNDTNMTSNYLTLECDNTITNTTNTISDINTVTSAGWFVVTAWLETDNNSSGLSPTRVMMSSSQDGGQSYNDAVQLVPDSTAHKTNLNLGISQEKVYASYEQVMPNNQSDVLLMKSINGGESFGSPENISNNTANSSNSILTVDPLTGKWILTYTDTSTDTNSTTTTIEDPCGHC